MARLAKAGKANQRIRGKALELTRYLRAKDWGAQVYALFEYVRDDIRYIHDTWQIETVHTPEQVMDLGQGDCDDKSILLAALLESIGHPARFMAVGFKPGSLSHVYVQTRMGRTKAGPHWVSLDATESHAPVGWEPPGIRARMVVEV